MRRAIKFLLIAAVLIVAGCEHRPLEMPNEHTEVHVIVNVSAICNVTTHIYNEHVPVPDIKPEMLRVLFYDPQTHRLVTQAFISEKYTLDDGTQVICGDIKVLPGTYDILCYNFDLTSTTVTGEGNFDMITASTPQVDESILSRFESKADEVPDIRYQPDHLLVARNLGFEILPHVEKYIIKAEATTVIDTYYLQIRIKDGHNAQAASASISGLSSSNRIGPNIRNMDSPAATFFDLNKCYDIKIEDDNQEVLCAIFNTFGKIPDADSELSITFRVQTRAGGVAEKVVNMNEIFKTEDAIKRHWLLIDEIWEIPLIGGTAQGGFRPELGDWQEEHEEIEM